VSALSKMIIIEGRKGKVERDGPSSHSKERKKKQEHVALQVDPQDWIN